MAARILIVDDHQIMREGLRLLFRDQPDLEVVGNALDTNAGWKAVADCAPDLVVMDLDVPTDGGAALTARIRAKYPLIKIVVLTGHTEAKYVEQALTAGADGFVFKAGGGEDLLHAVRTVLSGRKYLCAEASTIVVTAIQRRANAQAGNEQFPSAREREVLKQIADGYSTKEIAFALGLSAKTVETHRTNLMVKLRIKSVAELTKYALREGLTRL